MKSRAERQQSTRTRLTVAPAAEGATERSSPRTRAPRCDQRKHRRLHDEAVKQIGEAAEEIMRANVERAKDGSITHTKWLFSLMDAIEDEGPFADGEKRKSLAEILIEQLKNKQ